jgi:N-acetylglucosamine kinase-like BadF-type ATPase
MRLALAVDGGNSKTDVALVREDGAVLGLARGGGSSPHHLGADASLELIEALIAELDPLERPAIALLLLAGVDFPDEEEALEQSIRPRRWADAVRVRNDSFAVLRAGTDRGWGIAVVCGAGINCLGVGPDGRHARFPALGAITGDWGGGQDLGEAALFAAARSEDGRGPRTELERFVPEHFRCGSPSELARAIHRGEIRRTRLTELAPVVTALARDDAVAASIVARLVEEVAAFIRVAAARLGLESDDVEVVLGGGLLQHAAPDLVAEIAARVHEAVPRAVVRPTAVSAIFGSALLALDELGAGEDAKRRLRAELEEQRVPVSIGDVDG